TGEVEDHREHRLGHGRRVHARGVREDDVARTHLGRERAGHARRPAVDPPEPPALPQDLRRDPVAEVDLRIADGLERFGGRGAGAVAGPVGERPDGDHRPIGGERGAQAIDGPAGEPEDRAAVGEVDDQSAHRIPSYGPGGRNAQSWVIFRIPSTWTSRSRTPGQRALEPETSYVAMILSASRSTSVSLTMKPASRNASRMKARWPGIGSISTTTRRSKRRRIINVSTRPSAISAMNTRIAVPTASTYARAPMAIPIA